jgi:hypothetical protein
MRCRLPCYFPPLSAFALRHIRDLASEKLPRQTGRNFYSMRSPKQRSRSKQNRPKTLGNIVNRVFDSSGPEGKVRGTPQQIIEKYQLLARDAQLSNDRVAAENFQQHAEHYTRMLAQATREMQAEADARRLAHEEQQRQQEHQRQRHQDERQNRHQNNAPRREAEESQQPQPDLQPDYAAQSPVAAAPAMQAPVAQEEPASSFALVEDAVDTSGLVETPEMAITAPQADAPNRAPRDRRPEKRREPRGDAPVRAEAPVRTEEPAAGADAPEAAKPRRNIRRPRKPDAADPATKAAE